MFSKDALDPYSDHVKKYCLKILMVDGGSIISLCSGIRTVSSNNKNLTLIIVRNKPIAKAVK
ncbi:MAG: hypothetical protein QXO15_09855 [Nitrososphaerota archaeon]